MITAYGEEWSGFALTNDAPYLDLTGEIWGSFCELMDEETLRYIKTILYFKFLIAAFHIMSYYVGPCDNDAMPCYGRDNETRQ